MTAGASRGSEKPLITKLEARDCLSHEEKALLGGLFNRQRDIAAGEDIVREGDRPWESTLLLEGFSGRYNLLRDGSRQITALHVTGDFVDLHAFLLKKMDHGITALTRCLVATAPHDRLRELTDRHPHLTRLLWLSTLIDGAIHRQWLVAMGRHSSVAQLAHMICELYVRLRDVGQTHDNRFRLPLTQTQMADMLGLSSIHVNRILRELREQGLMTWSSGEIAISDWDGLVRLAEFDPTYLSDMPEPR